MCPSICCETCIIAERGITSRAYDYKCVDCCARHILHTIEALGNFGPDGHAEQIKDRVFEKLSDSK